MTIVSPSILTLPVRLGTVTTADGPEACGLIPMGTAHLSALAARGLEPATLARLSVNASERLDGELAVGFPYVDRGVVVAVKHRTLGPGKKKFTAEKGGKQVLYNVDALRMGVQAGNPVVITEGELDAATAIQCGFPWTVSVPGGAPAAQPDPDAEFPYLDLPLFEGVSEIILATDDDDPGRILREALALRLGRHRCKWVTYPEGCKDLNEVLQRHGEAEVAAVLGSSFLMDITGGGTLSQFVEPPNVPAMDIGIIGLQDHYKIRLGDFCVVTGIPSHGKSSFINEVCCRMAQKYGWKTIFFSPEQATKPDHRRALRTFFCEKIEYTMTPQEKAMADAWIERHFIFTGPVEDQEADLPWILETFAQFILRSGAKIAVIDPWNEIEHKQDKYQSQTAYVGEAIKILKKFARKYGIHLIVAAHPTKLDRGKDGKTPCPRLYDISDSAHWANKPDVGIIIHRPNMDDGVTDIILDKVRYHTIGVRGTIKGSWNIDRTRYTILNDQEEAPF